jgi:hypothetical protein
MKKMLVSETDSPSAVDGFNDTSDEISLEGGFPDVIAEDDDNFWMLVRKIGQLSDAERDVLIRIVTNKDRGKAR